MRRAVVITVVAVVAILCMLVLVVPRALHTGGTAQSAGDSVATDTAEGGENQEVPSRPSCGASTVGRVELPCLGSPEQPVGEFSAGVLAVVNVWAWWCVPCREELPVVQEFAARNPDIAVVGVHADPDTARGAELLDDLGITLASFEDESNAFAGALGLPSVVPVTVVMQDGEVRAVYAQEFETVEDLEAAVAEAV